MHREAVGRHNVESDSGQQHDARLRCLGVTLRQRFEHVDLARDVEVVRARSQTDVSHRLASGGEWASDVQYDIDLAERGVEPGRVRELEGAVLQAERVRDAFQLCLTAAGDPYLWRC